MDVFESENSDQSVRVRVKMDIEAENDDDTITEFDSTTVVWGSICSCFIAMKH